MIMEQNPDISDHQYRDSFDILFNQIEDCLFVLDEKGRIIHANKAALEKLDYLLEEIINLSIDQLHPLAGRQEIQTLVKGILAGDISNYSVPLFTKSEKQIPAETRIFKGKWEGNNVLFAICKDVSAVENPDDHLTKALRCKSSMTALSKLETGEYVDVNDVLVQTLGYERNEILGKNAKDLDLFLDPTFRDGVITKIIERGCPINCEVMIKDKGGNIHDGLFLAEMIELSNHKYLLTMISDVTETRKLEKKAQILKNIELIINGVPCLTWMKDKAGKYIIINKVFENFYGIKNTEIVGKTDFELFPYKIALEHKKSEEKLLTSKKRMLNPHHLDNVGGKWLETFVAPFFEDNGEVAGTLGVANNITERMQLELELANQRRLLNTILNTIPDYIFYKDINSVFLGCNSAFCENVLGVNEGKAVGKTDFDLLKDIELAKFYRQKDQEVISHRKMLRIEEKIMLTDGCVIDSETVKAPFLDEQGNVAGLIGIARDITERKRLEKQLRDQIEYAELLFSTVPSAVILIDKHRKIVRWNKMAEKITGYTAAEAIGKECSRVLHGTDKSGCEMCLRVNDAPLINEMCQIVTKEGQIRFCLKSIAVFRNEFGVISERMECFEDITSLIDMEAKLRESKETYSAIVNNAPQFVIIHNKGVVKFVNDASKEAFGYETEGDINPRHIKEFIAEKSLARVNSALLDRSEGKSVGPYEIELINKFGETINVLTKGTEISFQGELATLTVMMDITESKQLNAKLRASEEKFRQFADTVNEIFLITDQESILYVSPAYERISGMSCQSLLDRPHSLVELIHTVDRKRMRTSFPQTFLDMSKATNEEFRIIRPDGEMRWLWLQSYPVLDKANHSVLKATSIVDITDRKKIEEKLYERERQTQMELLLAARVQKDSLPRPFEGDEVRVSTIFEPHRIVSGDFFNFKWFEEQRKLCGYIIDVSGHGVATALQTATFKMMLDNVLLNGEEIKEEAIQAINQKVMEYLHEDSFVALLYFEFDLQAGVLKLISAGITLFLAAKPQGCSLVPISGCYLGIINDPEIGIKTIPLQPGEIYCMMSDGASDLIEVHGTSKWGSSGEYKQWFEELAESPDRNDDFSVICIEILKENKEMNVLEIENERDLERAQVIISKFLEHNTPRYASTLEVAINEALNNGYYAGGRVRLKLRRLGGILLIRVKDDGPGFNTQEVKRLLEKEIKGEEFDQLLEAEGGRGIPLMRLFCDRVIYNAKGNEVLLMKNLKSIKGDSR